MIPLMSLALTFATQTASLSDGPQRDYPLQTTFSYSEAERITAPCLVECLAVGARGSRRFEYLKPDPGEEESSLRSIRTETVRVLDSPALVQKATIRIVAVGNSMFAPGYSMVPGHRYLVLASLPKGGRLETPHSGLFNTGVDVASALPGEVSGLAAFETHATALSPLTDPAERIADSVADCVVDADADAEGVHRVALWLKSAGYPGGGYYNNLSGREPFPLSKKIRGIAAIGSAYVRYELFQVLCDWHVFGSEQGYVDALLELSKEESDPFLPGDTIAGNELTFSQGRTIQDPSYVPVRLDANQWADTIVSARNDAVRGLLLRYVGRIPDEAHERKLAKFLLASENPGLVALEVGRLSRLLKRPDLEPQYRLVNGRSTWTNRDAALAELRAKYGVDAP